MHRVRPKIPTLSERTSLRANIPLFLDALCDSAANPYLL